MMCLVALLQLVCLFLLVLSVLVFSPYRLCVLHLYRTHDQCGDTTEKSQAPDDGCINPLTPNDFYSGCTAPLKSKRCILYIYSTNIGTEYFKHGIYSPFFSLQNAVCFIILMYLVPVLFTFYIQCVLKLKK